MSSLVYQVSGKTITLNRYWEHSSRNAEIKLFIKYGNEDSPIIDKKHVELIDDLQKNLKKNNAIDLNDLYVQLKNFLEALAKKRGSDIEGNKETITIFLDFEESSSKWLRDAKENNLIISLSEY